MIRSLFTLAALTAGATSLLAQPAIKLVVVDMAKVFDGYYKTEENNAKFRDAQQKAEEQVEELNKQGQTLVDDYKEKLEQSKNTLLTPEARAKAETDAQQRAEDIQRKQAEVQNFRANTQRSLQQRITQSRNLLLEEISKIANDVGKRKGATLIVDKSGPTLLGIPGVLYADPGFDITDEVLTEVNKDRPAPAPAAAPATGTPGATPPAAGAQSGFSVPNVNTPAKPDANKKP